MSRKNQENVEPVESEVSPEDAAKEKAAQERAEMAKSLAEAKSTLFDFMNTDIFKSLEEAVQNAIKRMSKKATATTGTASTQGFLNGLFPSVGHAIDEFELFKMTKIGRAEMKKKVHYAMKKVADPAQNLWIRFDEPTESWVLDAIGGDMPSNWTEADMPVTRTKKADVIE